MGSIRGPFLLTLAQFLVAAVIVGGAAVLIEPETTEQRMTVVVVVAIAVLIVTHYYRRTKDDSWPALRVGETVDKTVGIDDGPVRLRMIEAGVLDDPPPEATSDDPQPDEAEGSTADGEGADPGRDARTADRQNTRER